MSLDLKYLVKNGFAKGASFGMQQIVGLIIIIILTRKLSLEEIGLYKQTILSFELFALFLLPGISRSPLVSLSNKFHSAKIQALKLQIGAGLIGIAILAIYNAVFPNTNNTLTGLDSLWHPLFLALIAFCIARIAHTQYAAQISSIKNFQKLSIIDICIQAVRFISVIIALHFSNSFIDIIVFSSIALCISEVVVAMHNHFKHKIQEGRIKKDPHFISSSITFSGLNVIHTITRRIDHIITIFLFGASTYAIYAIANTIPIAIKGINRSISSIYFPKIAEREVQTSHKAILKKIPKTILCLIAYAAVSSIAVTFIIPLAFGDQFQQSIIIAQILTIAASFHILINIINNFYAANRIHKQLYANHFILLITKCIAIGIAAPFGIFGLAIATSSSSLLSTAIITTQFMRKKFDNI